eukprot:104521-Hanusia_phi.AAC.1
MRLGENDMSKKYWKAAGPPLALCSASVREPWQEYEERHLDKLEHHKHGSESADEGRTRRRYLTCCQAKGYGPAVTGY